MLINLAREEVVLGPGEAIKNLLLETGHVR